MLKPCENPACQQMTGNPRFCSRSCAITVNNRLSPKRSVEGSCIDCGTAIAAQTPRCPICKEAFAQETRRQELARRSLRTLSGELLPLPEGVRVHDRFVYSVRQYRGAITLEDPCARLIETLLGAVREVPPYLTQSDCHRYATLLHEFGAYVVDATPVVEHPLKELAHLLNAWIRHADRTTRYRLLSSFFLDCAEFIWTHAFGREVFAEDGPTWEIEPLVELVSGQSHAPGFAASDLKRRITQRVKGLIVKVKAPEDATLEDREGRIIVPSETEAICVFEHCHLSENVYDFPDLVVKGRALSRHLAEEFKFFSRVVSPKTLARNQGDTSLNGIDLDRHSFRAYIPGEWIREERTEAGAWLSLPTFSPYDED